MQSSPANLSFSQRWAGAVTSRWRSVLLGWLLLTIVIRIVAPSWNDVAYDGDFEYLPAGMTSVEGGRLLDRAFPGERSRSQIVLVLGRDAAPLTKTDPIVGLDLLRRLYHRLGEVCWQRAIKYGYQGGVPDKSSQWSPWIESARQGPKSRWY